MFLQNKIKQVHKRRKKHNEAEVANLIGDLENKHAIIIDDMIDTAGTICNAANTAINKGANSVCQRKYFAN